MIQYGNLLGQQHHVLIKFKYFSRKKIVFFFCLAIVNQSNTNENNSNGKNQQQQPKNIKRTNYNLMNKLWLTKYFDI